MAEFCLLPEKVEDFKKALKDKTLDLAALLDPKMTSEARTELFRPYAGDAAGEVNKLFESKLVLKNRLQGIKNFVSKLGESGRYSPEGKAALAKAAEEYRAAQAERIFSPKEHEAFLNDLADKAVGTHISKDVANKVFELSAKADELKNVNPKMSGVSDEYLQARNQLNAYVATQKNTSVAGDIAQNVATLARNNLLFNPATPLKTLEGQAVNGTMEAIGRRIANRSLGGESSDLARQANAEAWQTFRKTGVNTASAESISDIGLNKLGERLNMNGPSSGNFTGISGKTAAAVRGLTRLSNKIVIDWGHNLSFTKFYQKTFFDSANIFASKVAKWEGMNAQAIFKDAVRIEPETPQGIAVRKMAQMQAMRVTSTNPTWLSNLAMAIRKGINKATPGWRVGLGDLIIPIAKIPATIVANSIETAGPGLIFGARDIYLGKQAMASTDVATRLAGLNQMMSGYQKLTRTVGVIGAAAWFTSGLKPKDFQTDKWGNHQVHISGHWVNTEYIAMFSAALAGMMEAKSRGTSHDDIIATGSQYVAGALGSLRRAPGVDELANLRDAVTNPDMEKGLLRYAKSFFGSRIQPRFVGALESDRPMNELAFGSHGVESDAQVRKDEQDTARKRALTRAGG